MAASVLAAVASVQPVDAQVGPELASRPAIPVTLLAGPDDANTAVPRSSFPGTGPSAKAALTPITFLSGFPETHKAAVTAAVGLWAGLVTSSQPITISARYSSLGSGTLATGGPTLVFSNFAGAPFSQTWYPQALAEALSGQNLGGGDYDIRIDINSRNDWYTGTDGNTPTGRYDLMSVVFHEVAHGLGILGTMFEEGSKGGWGFGDPTALPDVYDRFTEDSQGRKLLSTTTYPNPSSALRNALESGGVYFNSAKTNRGSADRPRLWAPSDFTAGSSYAHLDENTYPAGSANSLPTPFLSAAESVHAPGPLTLCILEALGWSTPQDCTPPAPTSPGGSTWYQAGGSSGSGPSGSEVSAFASGATPGKSYKLVSGLDGGAGRPCMWDTVVLNPAVRVPTGQGVLGLTTGSLNRPPGRWQVCFREEGAGATVLATAPRAFTVG